MLTVVHLLYTTGHTAPTGADLIRDDLVERALHLARTLRALMPDEREVRGLLALLLLTDARRATRTDADGRLLPARGAGPLAVGPGDDRRGAALVVDALRGGPPRPVRAAGGDRRRCTPSRRPTPRPTGRRSSASTTSCCGCGRRRWSRSTGRSRSRWWTGRRAALAEIAALEQDGRLAGYRYLPAVKADLLRRLGRPDEAAVAYERRWTSSTTTPNGST